MALNENKINTQTKNELQTNGSYKINRIIIKIKEYTQKQSQNSPTKIKYNRWTWRTKEIKNYIYQLRTKLTKAQTVKQS